MSMFIVGENEADIVSRAADGDSEAFSALVEQYQSMIYNLALHSLHSSDDAFDVAQDVFLKAYRALPTFRGGCKFSTWLYKIAQNTIRDYIRSSSRRGNTVSLTDYDRDTGEEKQLDIPDTDRSSDPVASLERKNETEAVREAILALPDTHRDIIIMRDINGLSYEDIAEQLGLELGTVKSRLNRARASVKNYLVSRNFF